MDWLADILKNLTISKALVTAIFLTSVVMYFGPIISPASVPKIQSEFMPYIFAGMVLTGCLMLFWGGAWIWLLAKKSVRGVVRIFTDSRLSELETALVFIMAKDPTQPINLDNIDYSRAPGSKLEFHHWTKQLQAKGLARINEWDDNLVSLTGLGQNRALEIQRQAKSTDAA